MSYPGLYDVPQTDSTSEAAMAALVARLRASCPKPETIPLESAKPGTDAALALILFRVIGQVTSALGDRATPPLLAWDGMLDGTALTLAYVKWMNLRGRNRDAGADSSLDAEADEARAYLARLRPSSDGMGKSENPRFVDSGGNAPRDAPYVGSSTRADDWIARQGTRARGPY
jgi:hypothetical protein